MARGPKAKATKAAQPAGRPAKKRASKSTTPSPDTLAALSPDRLIRLILEEAGRNVPFRKRVSAALAGLQGPDAVAALVDRRLAALEKARGVIDWQKRKSFAADLDATVATIVSDLRPLDPGMALDRLIRFLSGAMNTLERVDDASGQVQDVYRNAATEAASIAAGLAPAQAARFATGLVPMLPGDEAGFIEALLADLMPGLPADALAPLDAALAAAPGALPAQAPEPEKRGFAVSDRNWKTRVATMRLIRLRQAVADARGDVDAFLALEEQGDREPDGAAIAERLLAAGRPEEALDWIRRPPKRGRVVYLAEHDGFLDFEAPERERRGLEIRILEALGRREEAQKLRWSWFEQRLDPQALRDHLAKLPDFEDDAALERAFAHAASREDPHDGLYFLTRWPRLDRAARMVLDRREEWRGQRWQWLVPAAEALEPDHPLAASLLYRALLDDILGRARSPAYGHGARQLAKLDALARQLEPGELVPDHATYRAALRKAHGRKSGFWSLIDG